MSWTRIAVVGDYNAQFVPHTSIESAVGHGAARIGRAVDVTWVASEQVDPADLAGFDALWIAPGSPFRSMSGALDAISHGRTTGTPTLGTCGGYQYVVIEYARRVLGLGDAAHAEHDPYASTLFISELACSLAGQRLDVQLVPGSQAAACYGVGSAVERYYCNFGLNPEYQARLHEGGLRMAGTDATGEARVLELPDHPFFVATLFVPQTSSTREQPHPLVVGFVRAAVRHRELAAGSAVPGGAIPGGGTARGARRSSR